MTGLDNVTWQVLTVILTVTGFAISALLWQRRGPASGIRGVAWSLLPVAAYLTGTLRLVWEIGDSVVRWATRVVFSPFVWLGIAVAGVSAVLFVVAGQMRRRRIGTKGREPKAKRTRRADAALPSTPSRSTAEPPADEDLDDVEAILKKHGIQ